MQPQKFDINILSDEDFATASEYIGVGNGLLAEPDLIIAPDGEPYLYRWYLIPRTERSNVYFHIQTASDPERPLHDHPWDNMSVILAGGYEEYISVNPASRVYDVEIKQRKKGDVVFRKATHAHRLILPEGTPYTMTVFSTGPVIRDWGFWTEPGGGRPSERLWKWVPSKELIAARVGNVSMQKKGE